VGERGGLMRELAGSEAAPTLRLNSGRTGDFCGGSLEASSGLNCAAGLKLNSGRRADERRARLLELARASFCWRSINDRGRRPPVALDSDEGADAGVCRAGKTKGGFGGGGRERGDCCGLE
jgi:hypothetical protein